ncbi:MAG: LUD domain-containing protein [Vicinamibacteria bacterium]
MTEDRDSILRALRAARERRGPAAAAPPAAADRAAVTASSFTGDPAQLAAAFARAARQAGARVFGPCDPSEAAVQVVRLLREHGARELLCWDAPDLLPTGFTAELAAAGFRTLDHHLPADAPEREAGLRQAAEASAGVTGALAAFADSGALLLASGPSRPRLAWQLPDIHVCLLPIAAIRPRLADAGEELRRLVRRSAQVALVAGPARSTDVEQQATPAALGPVVLDVLLLA